MFTSEIGDAKILHGIIAVTLYVRTADVRGGACEDVHISCLLYLTSFHSLLQAPSRCTRGP